MHGTLQPDSREHVPCFKSLPLLHPSHHPSSFFVSTHLLDFKNKCSSLNRAIFIDACRVGSHASHPFTYATLSICPIRDRFRSPPPHTPGDDDNFKQISQWFFFYYCRYLIARRDTTIHLLYDDTSRAVCHFLRFGNFFLLQQLEFRVDCLKFDLVYKITIINTHMNCEC